jgi:SAM-dependent methyltransferase
MGPACLAAGAYPYLEEVNDGVLRQLRRRRPGRVLDVGCGRGTLAEAVRRLGWEVWGIEARADACATARGRVDRLIEADLTDFAAVADEVGPAEFDAVVFSDVLEHLVNPPEVLRHYLTYLRPGGELLISVPNFVVWANRLRLLLGVVAEEDTGVMDRTHLHIFSFRTARRLVESVGCRVERLDCTPHLARAFLPLIKRVLVPRGPGPADPRALIDSRAYRIYLKYLYPLERLAASLWPALLAFRVVVVGRKPPPAVEGEHGR